MSITGRTCKNQMQTAGQCAILIYKYRHRLNKGGVSSIVNLYEAPIAFLQEQFKFNRAVAVGVIGVIGLIVSISISRGPLSG